ncbi:MAG: hypothetical protein SFY69_12420 [Planctomycetota bacterium]|nr:hypothetical protein [Planctomycetota bacterium]
MLGVSRFIPIVASVAICAVACAQVQDVTPYYAVPAGDKVPIHCNDSDRFYRVGEISPGMLVVVDAESERWSRVSYPPGLSAFVRAVEVGVQGTTATLTTPSRLRAHNAAAGYDGSYKTLLDKELPAGTTLTIVEEVKDASGSIAAYRVQAPASARGFVPSRLMRRATDAEVATYRAKPGVSLPSLPGAPAGSTPAAQPPSGQPGSGQPGSGQPGSGQPPAVPPAPGATPETVPSDAPPASGEPAEIVQRRDPAAPEPVVPADASEQPGTPAPGTAAPTTPAPADERPVGTIERLDASFKRVWAQPVLEGEFDELMVEIERAIEQVSPDRAGQRRQLEGRLEALRIRRDYRDRLRQQEEARARLDAAKVRISEQLAEIARTRYYTIVGQLQPSLVYDGRDLPQMYRIVSVGATAPRTLGYLRKSAEFNLDAMLGQVVGVIGEAQLDRSLQLNVITPVTVDTLQAAPNQPAAPGTP